MMSRSILAGQDQSKSAMGLNRLMPLIRRILADNVNRTLPHGGDVT
jgi:hypothetical protein